MLIAILLVSVVLLVVGAIWYNKRGYYDDVTGPTICISIGAVAGLLSLIICLVGVIELAITSRNDEQIEYLVQNNVEIENKIEETIKLYCEYEEKTYHEITPDNISTVFIIYPELKADSLFVFYIDTIVENNEMIKELKLYSIRVDAWRWWLYFGGLSND